MDLIQDGEYRHCDQIGQPYLLWSGGPPQYRIQVWGHLTENAKFKWYWDAVVSGPEAVVDDCMTPPERKPAIRIAEAWWNNFKNSSGTWSLGSGGSDPQTGLPSGSGLRYGRTVWHGIGQIPYLMTAGSSGSAANPDWCVDEVLSAPGK
jgi:hypothetical protein